jgi:hypothetical protein
MIVCLAYWEIGRPDKALTMANESVRLGELAGFMAAQVLAGGHRAAIYGHLGELEQGMALARQALMVAETHFPHFRCHPLGPKGPENARWVPHRPKIMGRSLGFHRVGSG